jgi:hypothetical protein
MCTRMRPIEHPGICRGNGILAVHEDCQECNAEERTHCCQASASDRSSSSIKASTHPSGIESVRDRATGSGKECVA